MFGVVVVGSYKCWQVFQQWFAFYFWFFLSKKKPDASLSWKIWVAALFSWEKYWLAVLYIKTNWMQSGNFRVAKLHIWLLLSLSSHDLLSSRQIKQMTGDRKCHHIGMALQSTHLFDLNRVKVCDHWSMRSRLNRVYF